MATLKSSKRSRRRATGSPPQARGTGDDRYQAERHPVGARVLQCTMAQRALGAPDERTAALRDLLAVVLTMEEPRKHIAGMISGLDVHYDLGGDHHPMLGWRMPDLDLTTANGPVRVFELLRKAEAVLLDFAEPGGLDIAPWADRVRLVDASYAGTWELPVLGRVAAPSAVLKAGRTRRLGWRRHGCRLARCPDDLVRSSRCGPAGSKGRVRECRDQDHHLGAPPWDSSRSPPATLSTSCELS